MTENLYSLTLACARELGILRESTATGGSTSTLIDTVALTQADDYWNLGCVWITYDAGGAGAAPQGQYSVITDFTTSNDTMALKTTLTAAVASGDRYAACRVAEGGVDWLNQMISKINSALLDIGPVPQTDITTITAATDQTEYTMSVAMGRDLREVWVANDTDTNDYQWTKIHNWRVQQHSTAGTADTLILPYQPSTSYAIKVIYLALHPALAIYTDKLSDHVPMERVVYPAVRELYRWRKAQTGWDKWNDEITRWEQRADAIKMNRSMRLPARTGKLMIVHSDGLNYESTADKVYLR